LFRRATVPDAPESSNIPEAGSWVPRAEFGRPSASEDAEPNFQVRHIYRPRSAVIVGRHIHDSTTYPSRLT
jgi:hypothetical protein